MHTRSADIVALAKSLYAQKIPYRHQGRSLSGLDCIGVPFYIMHYYDFSRFDLTDYGKRPNIIAFRKALADSGCRLIPYKDRAPGDILQMSYPQWPTHCAILEVENSVEWIIHSMLTRKKVSREVLSAQKDAQVSCAWRMPE